LPISGSRPKSTCSGRPDSSASIVDDAGGSGSRFEHYERPTPEAVTLFSRIDRR
jgi:hypothetical protein